MERLPDVSVITVNYNGLRHTSELIESVKSHINICYELIVVDNASGSNEADQIKKQYPWVVLVKNEKNLGFAGGNNAGIRVSRGRFILLLNNDTLIKDDSIRFLIERLDSNLAIGAVSPKIVFEFSAETIQFAGYTTLSPVTLRNRTIGFGEKDRGQHNRALPVPYLHGAALMLKREIIDKVGLMPEIYFLYYEEIDWCVKMTDRGYILYYEPRCVVYHKESQSTGQASSLRTFFITRNRLLFAYRNLKGIHKYVSLFYQMTVVPAKNSIPFLIRGRTDLVRSLFSGIYAFIVLKNKTS